MHQYKLLLQVFLQERIRVCRSCCGLTQETMAARLHITPRSYAYLEQGAHGLSATTLMFFLLVLTEEEVLQLRIDFQTLVERENEHVVA